ncbi:unnamed protein product [Urochloa humidicola]
MAAAEASSRRVTSGDGLDEMMKLVCSHGGRLLPRGPDGAVRYAGGETRVLAVPRDVSFRDLSRRLQEMVPGGAEVRSVMHRLADEGLEDVLVSVTCDDELAHMRHEYDRLRATRPSARFRLFVTTAPAAPAGSGVIHRNRSIGLPPLAPKMRRVQSEQAQLHRRPTHPAPVRRVQSAPVFACRVHGQCCCCCQRRDLCAPAPPPARQMYAAPYVSKKVAGAPSVPAAKATGRVGFADAAREKAAMSIDAKEVAENRRTIWELE